MMNNSVALLGLILLGCSSANEPQCRAANGYIYESSIDERAEVFNLETMTMSTQSKSHANIGRLDSEFAGPFLNCSNKSYFCISGTLNISIPINASLTSWYFNGQNCKIVSRSNADGKAIIECTSIKEVSSILAQYSINEGIISYRRQNVGDDAVFRTKGGCGLFSLK
jgi:hypothetical protein